MYKIPEDILNKILNVLGTLPYTQVAQLMAEIQQQIEKDESHQPAKKEEK